MADALEAARKAVEAASMKKTQVYQQTNDPGQRAAADKAVSDAYQAQIAAHNTASKLDDKTQKQDTPSTGKSAWQLLTGQ